uniref:PspA protein n=1 Tax=Serratia phage Kevin TaxID=3161161 RepID=A0AAU8KWY5_9CAUD
MSLKSLIKRIFRVAEANINAVAVDAIDTEKNYKLAAQKIHEKIHELEKGRVEIARANSDMRRQAHQFQVEAERIDGEIRYQLKNNMEVNKTRATLAVRKHKMAEVLVGKADEGEGRIVTIAETVVALGQRLNSIADELELIAATKRMKELGVENPDEIQYRADLVNVEVDTLIRESEVFDRHNSAASSVSDVDVEQYLAKLKAE